MAAARVYLTSKDIAQVAGVSLREAQYILNMFEQRNQVVSHGRKKTVYINTFCRYLSEQDGSDPHELKKEIQQSLRQAN